MENLNAEQVKNKLEQLALEPCMAGTTIKGHSVVHLLRDALALINSQEQRIGELAEERDGLYRLVDDKIQENKRLTEENERLRAIPEQICEEARQMCFIVGDEEYITLCELDQIAKEMLEGEAK